METWKIDGVFLKVYLRNYFKERFPEEENINKKVNSCYMSIREWVRNQASEGDKEQLIKYWLDNYLENYLNDIRVFTKYVVGGYSLKQYVKMYYEMYVKDKIDKATHINPVSSCLRMLYAWLKRQNDNKPLDEYIDYWLDNYFSLYIMSNEKKYKYLINGISINDFLIEKYKDKFLPNDENGLLQRVNRCSEAISLWLKNLEIDGPYDRLIQYWIDNYMDDYLKRSSVRNQLEINGVSLKTFINEYCIGTLFEKDDSEEEIAKKVQKIYQRISASVRASNIIKTTEELIKEWFKENYQTYLRLSEKIEKNKNRRALKINPVDDNLYNYYLKKYKINMETFKKLVRKGCTPYQAILISEYIEFTHGDLNRVIEDIKTIKRKKQLNFEECLFLCLLGFDSYIEVVYDEITNFIKRKIRKHNLSHIQLLFDKTFDRAIDLVIFPTIIPDENKEKTKIIFLKFVYLELKAQVQKLNNKTNAFGELAVTNVDFNAIDQEVFPLLHPLLSELNKEEREFIKLRFSEEIDYYEILKMTTIFGTTMNELLIFEDLLLQKLRKLATKGNAQSLEALSFIKK